ncbi:MAG: RNA polymerase sigma-70 factor [Mangrovibacterium sp.]
MPIPEQPVTFYLSNGSLDISHLFEHYSRPLFYYALKFVDEEAAKDIVQDVFLKLWSDKHLHVSRSLDGLLFTMVRNKCLQHIEKQKVRLTWQQSSGLRLKEDEILFYSTEASSLIEQELQGLLEKAIDSLPEKCREVFILSRYHEKMNKEIAEELGISIKTVEKHITTAMKLLRTALKDYLPLFLLLQHPVFQNKSDFLQ